MTPRERAREVMRNWASYRKDKTEFVDFDTAVAEQIEAAVKAEQKRILDAADAWADRARCEIPDWLVTALMEGGYYDTEGGASEDVP